MKTIVITGPSGSGKTYLSKKLAKLFYNSIIINTDSYYRDDLYIKLLSIFIYDIYDRFISIKDKCLMKTITSIYNKEEYSTFYNYDFRSKRSSQSKKQIQFKNINRFIILEGIFAHRLDLNYESTINVLCKEKKEICYQRRLQRDRIERGRNIKEVNKKFYKSWDIYSKNLTKFLNKNNVLSINTEDNINYKLLISKLEGLS
tara:strand:- start:23 stop:628 length:606 start_codon:yes stop_codon:yes gene_type:complete